MKILLLVAAAITMTAAEHQALAVIQQFAEATRQGDAAKMSALMDKDYFEVSPAGELDLRDKVLGFYSKENFKPETAPKSVTVSEAHVVEPGGGSIAVITTKDTFHLETPQGPMDRSMRTTTVLAKVGTQWRIVSRQYTGIRPKK